MGRFSSALAVADTGAGGGGRYFRLAAGERCEVVVLSDAPVTRWQIWEGGKTRDARAGEPGAQRKWAINLYNVTARAVQRWELSTSALRALDRALTEAESAGASTPIIRVKRIGEGKQTVYDCEYLRDCTPDGAATIRSEASDIAWDFFSEGWELPTPAHPDDGTASTPPDDDIPF